MARFTLSLLLVAAAASLVTAQPPICVNEVQPYNRNDRTMAVSGSWFLIPIPKTAATAALKESFPALFNLGRLSLLDPPADLNLPPDTHPVIVFAGEDFDIRQGELQLATALMGSGSSIPYVSLGGSKTPIVVPLANNLAGVDGPTQAYITGLIPSIVGTVGGQLTRIGSFIPTNSPYQLLADGSLSINSKWAQAPNPVSGPGLYSEAIDLKFITTPSPHYTLTQWKRLINQPSLLATVLDLLSPKCVRNLYFFTNSTAVVTFRVGNATLGPSAGVDPVKAVLQRASPDGSGFYQGVQGFSSCGQVVGYGMVVPLGEDCEGAARVIEGTPGAL
ncbi:hypothetical protein NX059_000947 [Plenodomus lindquistii]|nr:hypothetical protein NX059_000947 [Plenodomus lindquistii]